MAATIYEHNFGFWEIDGQVEQRMLRTSRARAVQRTCDRCERRVRLMPPKRFAAPAPPRSNVAHPRR